MQPTYHELKRENIRLANMIKMLVADSAVEVQIDEITLLQQQLKDAVTNPKERTYLQYCHDWKFTYRETEFFLLLNKGRITTRDYILNQLYADRPVQPKILDVFISKMRKKMDACNSTICIQTAHSQGFYLVLRAKYTKYSHNSIT